MTPPNTSRADYKHFVPIQTRWMDNDVYGHVNNVVFYSFFDTIVNGFLVHSGALDIEQSPIIGLVVETKCNYFTPISFPENLEGALRVNRVGTSSVVYELGIFKQGEKTPVAEGHFVHVYVERETRRPTQLTEQLRAVLETLS